MDFYAGKMSLLNDIAQIETTLGDPGARPRRPLPDPKDTHRSTHTQMALFGPTIAWYEAYNLCDQPAPDGEPGGAGGRDKRGTENEHHRSLGRCSRSGGPALRSGLRIRADVRRPAGAPPRPDPTRERPGFGRSPAHPHPDQDRRGCAGAHRRPQARPPQRRDLRPARRGGNGDEGVAHQRRALTIERGEAISELVQLPLSRQGCRRAPGWCLVVE